MSHGLLPLPVAEMELAALHGGTGCLSCEKQMENIDPGFQISLAVDWIIRIFTKDENNVKFDSGSRGVVSNHGT